MLQLYQMNDLERANLTGSTESLVRQELKTLQDLSHSQTIDNEYGHVLVLEADDTDETIQTVLGRSFNQLLFEGMAYRNECFVGYLSGGGNERLVVLVCPERFLTTAWKMMLMREV